MGTIAVRPPERAVKKMEAEDTTKQYRNPRYVDPEAPVEEKISVLRDDDDNTTAITAQDGDNTILKVYKDDLSMIDARHAARLPPFVKRELNKAAYKEACRKCFEVEKGMSQCLQNKMWTAWKCEKERDLYFKCIDSYEKSPEAINNLRWKYNMGVYHGEVVARKRLMQHLWKEYFPDREMQHPWVED